MSTYTTESEWEQDFLSLSLLADSLPTNQAVYIRLKTIVSLAATHFSTWLPSESQSIRVVYRTAKVALLNELFG